MNEQTQSQPRRALVLGATGLVGARLLSLLGNDDRYGRVTTLGRRRPQVSAAGHVQHLLLDPAGMQRAFECDTTFCCLGTTLRRAGTRQAFRAVDFDLVVNLARSARDAGVGTFIVISSLGADPDSRNFYLRTKGETEQALVQLGFERLGILRPSLLLGARDERRPAEAAGQWLARMIDPLMLGPLRQFRGVDAGALARAMIDLDFTAFTGVCVVESAAIA